MGINYKALSSRPLTDEETSVVVGNTNKVEIINWLMAQFQVTTDEGEVASMPIGQGVEIGPFETANNASTFNSTYVTPAAEKLGWGTKVNGGSRMSLRTKGHVREREGKFYLWIVRRS